tara:strand:+ start:4364 stop:5125 length:762 start_codon:yes stop_codon:yes gene_type:complete
MFFSKKLKKFHNISHCFFSRQSGFSKGIYESLNCGEGSRDLKENILKNLNFVSEKVGCKNDSLFTLNQRHTNKVIYFESKKYAKNKLIGDAIVTKAKNLGVGILTADCASILFYDDKNKIIGCAHSGWRGALDGIIKNTVKKFNELNSNNKDLVAVIGPCIGKKNYEVGEDFFTRFKLKSEKNIQFFHKNKNNKYFFDLRGFINKELLDLDIKNIENIEMDTFSQNKTFYSYRRSLINGEKDYGRCISVILMT